MEKKILENKIDIPDALKVALFIWKIIAKYINIIAYNAYTHTHCRVNDNHKSYFAFYKDFPFF